MTVKGLLVFLLLKEKTMNKLIIGLVAIQLLLSVSGCCCNCAKKPAGEQVQNQQDQDLELIEQNKEQQQ